jgi:hypothetical protein
MPRDIETLINTLQADGFGSISNFSEAERELIYALSAEEVDNKSLEVGPEFNVELFKFWVGKNGRSFAEAEEVISLHYQNYKIALYVQEPGRDYAREVANPNSQFYNPFDLTREWFKENNSTENLKLAFGSKDSFFSGYDQEKQEQQEYLFHEFIENSKDKFKSVEEVFDLHKSLLLPDDRVLGSAASWLKASENNNIDKSTFSNLLLLKDQRSRSKVSLAQQWILKEENNLEEEVFLEVLKSNGSAPLRSFAYFWFQKNNLNLEQFKNLINSVEEKKLQKVLVSSWNNFSFEQFEEVFKIFKNNESAKTLLAISWFKKNGSNLEFDKFESVAKLIKGNQYNNEGLELADIWLNSNTTYDNFLKLSGSDLVFSHYDSNRISELFLKNKKYFAEKNFTDACKDLHPNNEDSQVDLFRETLRKISPLGANSANEEVKLIAISFAKSLVNDDAALEACNVLRLTLNITEAETLEIASQRLSSKYTSIKNLLAEKSLSESLTLEGLESVRNLFGNSVINDETKNLAEIFSYYDIKNDLTAFKSLLKPEVALEISRSFSPNSNSAYISENELQKIKTVFEHPKFSLNLPKTSDLTKYLKSKVVTKLREAENYKAPRNYQFGSSAVLNSNSRRDDLTESFKKLLKINNPDNSQIGDFFEKLLNPEPEITDENRLLNKPDEIQKLNTFFQAQKNTLAFLFAQENGIDDFCGVIETLGRGCVGHIGTQSKSALYQTLFQSCGDLNALILFNTFQEQIIEPIIGSEDNIAANPKGEDLLTLKEIVSTSISPNGLLAGITKQFYNNGKIRMNAENFLETEIGAEAANSLKQQVYSGIEEESDAETSVAEIGKKYDVEISRLAAYVVLKKTLPELCKNKYLTEKPRFLESLKETEKPNTEIFTSSCFPFFRRSAKVSPEGSTTADRESFASRLFSRLRETSNERS